VTTPNPALAAARDEDELTIASRRADGSLRPGRSTYRGYAPSILDHITSTQAQSTTMRLVPGSSTKD
jgi:hypothetical protein